MNVNIKIYNHFGDYAYETVKPLPKGLKFFSGISKSIERCMEMA